MYRPWPSELTDAKKICRCQCCTGTAQHFNSYEERSRAKRARLAGSCCARWSLTGLPTITSAGTDYTEGEFISVYGSAQGDIPAVFQVATVDVSGGITSLILINSGSFYTNAVAGFWFPAGTEGVGLTLNFQANDWTPLCPRPFQPVTLPG